MDGKPRRVFVNFDHNTITYPINLSFFNNSTPTIFFLPNDDDFTSSICVSSFHVNLQEKKRDKRQLIKIHFETTVSTDIEN